MNNNESTPTNLVYHLFNEMSNYSLSYIYNGDFSQKITDGILALTETNMNNYEEQSSVKKRVYFLLVEALQNITRHKPTSEDINDINSCFFIIQKLNDNYFITSANPIENRDIAPLKQKLETVNELDQERLKAYHKQLLEQGSLSSKGGAGLGLIEMARKSGNKLVYNFDEIDSTYSRFYFQVKVGNNDEGSSSDNILESAKTVHELTLEKNISLIYSGDFSQENLKNVLSITEESISKKDNIVLKKKIFNIIVEIVQNILKHAHALDDERKTIPGIFMISHTSASYTIITGNLISNKQIVSLKEKLNEVNNANDTELENLYNLKLLSEVNSKKGGAGLGLIDLKLKSNNSLIYDFIPVDAQNSFYTLQINVSNTN